MDLYKKISKAYTDGGLFEVIKRANIVLKSKIILYIPPSIYVLGVHAFSFIHPRHHFRLILPTTSNWVVYDWRERTIWHTPDPKKAFLMDEYGETLIQKYTEEGFIEISDTDTVVDIGAFIGGFSREAAKQADQVVAIEPTPSSAKCLQQNLVDLDNITIKNIAIWWENTEELSIQVAKDPTDNSINQPDSSVVSTIQVNAKTIDNLEISNIDFLKLDAEGVEPEVFDGWIDTNIQKIAVDCSPERDGETTVSEVEAELKNRGYEVKTNNGIVLGKLK